eukprot:1159311-Pelagomonas_calceolata.AAC.5
MDMEETLSSTPVRRTNGSTRNAANHNFRGGKAGAPALRAWASWTSGPRAHCVIAQRPLHHTCAHEGRHLCVHQCPFTATSIGCS